MEQQKAGGGLEMRLRDTYTTNASFDNKQLLAAMAGGFNSKLTIVVFNLTLFEQANWLWTAVVAEVTLSLGPMEGTFD